MLLWFAHIYLSPSPAGPWLVSSALNRGSCGAGVEPASCYQKAAGSIPCMSECPWASWWSPNCSLCADRYLAWQPHLCMYVWIAVSCFGQKCLINSLKGDCEMHVINDFCDLLTLAPFLVPVSHDWVVLRCNHDCGCFYTWTASGSKTIIFYHILWQKFVTTISAVPMALLNFAFKCRKITNS